HEVKRAKFPFIDVHNHQRDVSPQKLGQLIRDMDTLNMAILVNSPVNGSWGAQTKASIDAMRSFNKDRFAMMTNIEFNDVDNPNYSRKIAAQLEEDFKNGAVALKVWKNFGLSVKDSKGNRIHVDDPRYDAAWQMCAKYKRPVLIHTADPKGLFMPMNKDNERWLELKMRSGRMHTPGVDPEWETLIGEQHNLFRKHKNTIFIDAHLGWLGFDLGRLGKLMDECPNVYTEIGAVTSELGRQPRFARQFMEKYQDRVLFGKDAYNVQEYYTYFRLLETADEYFDPIRRYHGIWKMYGLDLPDNVLKKLYYKNALRIIPGLNASLFPQ
ncbi:MAG TPA: amidohydrolase family protein, partial [Bryobacteraceae bacterium]|nr:amidohydrolase family protein [Bryobacteraceae bacterium]